MKCRRLIAVVGVIAMGAVPATAQQPVPPQGVPTKAPIADDDPQPSSIRKIDGIPPRVRVPDPEGTGFGQPPQRWRPNPPPGLRGPMPPGRGGRPGFPGMVRSLEDPRLQDLKEFDPDMYELEKRDIELEQRTLELSQQYRRAPRDRRESLKKELSDAVQQHFEARQARRNLQFKRLEEELNRMRTAMERRTQQRDQIIERRVTELIGEQHELDF